MHKKKVSGGTSHAMFPFLAESLFQFLSFTMNDESRKQLGLMVIRNLSIINGFKKKDV